MRPELLTIVARAMLEARADDPHLTPRAFVDAVATVILASDVPAGEVKRALFGAASEIDRLPWPP